MDSSPIFGFPDEWKAFRELHPEFLLRFPHLQRLLEATFLRELSATSVAARTIFFLGRLAVEDFMEILLLCGKAYGHGARKLIRGLFERVVTAEYLRQNPAQAEDFTEFGWVNHFRLLQEIQENFPEIALDAAIVKDVEDNYGRVRGRFLIPLCDKCGTTRLNHTWTRLDIVSMAKNADREQFRVLIVPGYRIPLLDAHATLQSLTTRVKDSPEGLSFRGELQRQTAEQVLVTAHHLILLAVQTQLAQFPLQDGATLQAECVADFSAIWGSGPSAGKSGTAPPDASEPTT